MDIVNQIPAFMLVLTRILAMFTIVPVLSQRGVPAQFRVGLGFFIALAASAGLNLEETLIPIDGNYVFLVVKEFTIGIMMGFMATLFMAALQTAGHIIDVEMGFGMVNVVDPQSGTQVPIMGFFKYYIATLIFLSLNIHHIVILAYIESFQYIPLGGIYLEGRYAEFVVSSFANMFLIAIKIAAPVAFTLLIATVALGITARTVPQMNVFVVGMPLKIGLGLIFMIVSLPTFLFMIDILFTEMLESIHIMVQIIANSNI